MVVWPVGLVAERWLLHADTISTNPPDLEPSRRSVRGLTEGEPGQRARAGPGRHGVGPLPEPSQCQDQGPGEPQPHWRAESQPAAGEGQSGYHLRMGTWI